MIACVGATDRGRVHACLSSHSQFVVAVSCSGGGGKPRECLEVQPQLTDVIRHLAEGEGAGGSTGCSEAAGVARVPDVCRVRRYGGPAGRGGDDAADAKACSTVTVSAASSGAALRAGVARPIGGARARACALLVGELDDREE